MAKSIFLDSNINLQNTRNLRGFLFSIFLTLYRKELFLFFSFLWPYFTTLMSLPRWEPSINKTGMNLVSQHRFLHDF